MSTQPKTFLTPEEYLELERRAEYKSEYYGGEMFAMSGGTDRHTLIGFHLLGLLYGELRGSSCRAYTSDMRVCVGTRGPYYYPDASVVCGESKFADQGRDNLLNPTAIFEVLSPSTAAYDMGEKFVQYKKIASLREYVVVHQETKLVQRFDRREEDQWLLTMYEGVEGTVALSSVPCVLPMAEIYEGLD